jgi:hypothetical protein
MLNMNKLPSSILLLLILSITLSRCDEGLENPNYPIEPSIEFKSIEFIEVPGPGTADSLKLKIKYRDGDSDLGLDYSYESDDFEFPYHNVYYFLEDGTGDTAKIYTEIFDDGSSRHFLLNPSITGKLVTNRTRLKPNYGFLPEFESYNCLYYSEDQLLVSEESGAVDETYNILDTLVDEFNKRYFIIQEAFLYQRNENHYNILVEFYISDDGINFTEFEWNQHCISYNGRFPLLLDNTGIFKSGPFTIKAKTPWEGEIIYSMGNASHLALFSAKKMKLKIKIKDRAFHTSNVIETPVFTLDEIRKD